MAHVLTEAVEYILQPPVVGGGRGKDWGRGEGGGGGHAAAGLVVRTLVLAVPDGIHSSGRNVYLAAAQVLSLCFSVSLSPSVCV
jgi:hypothetical protein